MNGQSTVNQGAASPNPEVVALLFQRFVEWKLEQEEKAQQEQSTVKAEVVS